MPGTIVTFGAVVQCSHGGKGTATTPSQKVFCNGDPVVTLASQYAIAGCSFPPPNAGNGPCVTAQFTTGATKVLVMGQPVLLLTSTGTCVPTGTPALVASSPAKVTAT